MLVPVKGLQGCLGLCSDTTSPLQNMNAAGCNGTRYWETCLHEVLRTKPGAMSFAPSRCVSPKRVEAGCARAPPCGLRRTCRGRPPPSAGAPAGRRATRRARRAPAARRPACARVRSCHPPCTARCVAAALACWPSPCAWLCGHCPGRLELWKINNLSMLAEALLAECRTTD